MEQEQERILAMLAEGTISAEEAQNLLAAVEATEGSSEPDGSSAAKHEPAPNFDHIRSTYWKIPFAIALGSGLLSGNMLKRGRRNSSGLLRLLATILWGPLFLLSIATAAFSFWSRTAPWLHIRVRQADGSKVNISVPLPITVLKQLLNQGLQSAPPEQADKIEAFGELLDALGDKENQPIFIASNDEDREQVELFLG